ncbi:hypothetical protein RMN57_13265 [Kitasatospora sp. CM 4170]|uniref:Tail assembly chaperone n=1 Tax=Kitasatospora aburaviensis TaxID=67265 RepID=A0ABW1EUZ4_9ACTN|nr:hypothetical protein [Kitasatospora sp. CM 4170]WNM45623.1 hypothetical protein RMN57_13265 [Kitasatospora sp. CM 4170]
MTSHDTGYPDYEDSLVDDEDDLDPDEDIVDNDYEDDESVEAFADADAFFAAEVAKVVPATLRLYGKSYVLPKRVPLTFTLMLARHQDDEDMDAFAEVLTPLFGEDALQYWLDRGIDDRQLAIVLAWAVANVKRPGVITLAEAARAYDKQTTDRTRGKGPAAPRTPASSSGSASSGTGPSSKRTSAGSTSSRRKKSRR